MPRSTGLPISCGPISKASRREPQSRGVDQGQVEEPRRRQQTGDADLLGFGPDDIATAVTAFKEICNIEFEDGIRFDPASVKGTVIRKEAGYGGVRVDLLATLNGARISLQIDIGFGDAVTPGPEHIEYPVLIEGLPAPQLRAYPKYTVVAEKFHAICLLGMTNTRMKDYFDLVVLLAGNDIDPVLLDAAIDATFKRRMLDRPQATPVGLSDAFADDAMKQKQWAAFIKKGRLDAPDLVETTKFLRDAFTRLGIL